MFKVDNSVSLNDFDTISQYIKWLCKRKGITIKKCVTIPAICITQLLVIINTNI